ncbi:MAG: DMT family transporter [Clostridia bacterium]|nr:DMT family transporter [Clostridia bacterium]
MQGVAAMGKKLTALLFVVCFASCMTAIAKILPGLPAGMDTYRLVFWIFALIFFPMNVIFFIIRFWSRNKSSGSFFISVLAAAFLMAGIYLFAAGASGMGAGNAIAFVFLTPLITIALLPAMSKEKLSPGKILAVIVAAGGAACIFIAGRSDVQFSANGFLLILGASACWSMFSLISARTRTITHVNVYIYVTAGVVISTAAMFLQSGFKMPEFRDMGALLILAALFMASIFFWAAAYKPASVSFWATAVYIVPAFMLLYEIIFRSGTIGVLGIAGFSVLGIALIYRMSVKA